MLVPGSKQLVELGCCQGRKAVKQTDKQMFPRKKPPSWIRINLQTAASGTVIAHDQNAGWTLTNFTMT